MAFKIPRPIWSQAIVDKLGMATRAFSRRIDEAFTKIEQQEASQDSTIADIQAIQAQLQQQLDLITTAQATANAAQTTANNAQTSADAGGSPTARSGSATADVLVNSSSWIDGPTVSLSTVSSGVLTIVGSGPTSGQLTTGTLPNTTVEGEWRILENPGAIDVGFLGTWSYFREPDTGYKFVTNNSNGDAAGFVLAETTTGSIDYLVQVRKTSGSNVTIPVTTAVRRS